MLAAETGQELRHVLRERLAGARQQTDDLFGIVRSHALYERPIAERHRIVFYIGHLEAFDWNLLRERALGLSSVNPEFDRLFAFGIDPVGGGLPTDQPHDWPSLQRVREYVQQVRETLDRELEPALSSGANRVNGEFPVQLLLNVAIEHRLMHAETLAYMLHQLPLDQKVKALRRADVLASAAGHVATSGSIEIPEGRASLGLSRDDPQAFGWDNEYEFHQVHVPAFAIDKYKVSNGEYLEFIRAGGYDERSLWSDAGWSWKVEKGISHPVFWQRNGGEWHLRTMFEEIPLPLDWPVYVSHAEGSAYARWAGKKLPSEAQWHRAAFGTPGGEERKYPWGNEPPDSRHGNFDFQRWDPVPVTAFPAGQSAYGVAGMVGNGWEWTSSLFQPFAGFQRFSFYPGYSADFFDGKHYVMIGGSARTAACMVRRSFRNWFQPHYQYVYAGFRCVKD